jgi:hypothetical protein
MFNQTEVKDKNSKQLGFVVSLFKKEEGEEVNKFCFINKTYRECEKTFPFLISCICWKWVPFSSVKETPEEIFELTRENACYRLTPVTQNE